jgi:hypothetical protein
MQGSPFRFLPIQGPMKEARHPRGLRDRKAHLSPDAERLVSAALGLSNSGSRTEDRFWEQALAARIADGERIKSAASRAGRSQQVRRRAGCRLPGLAGALLTKKSPWPLTGSTAGSNLRA